MPGRRAKVEPRVSKMIGSEGGEYQSGEREKAFLGSHRLCALVLRSLMKPLSETIPAHSLTLLYLMMEVNTHIPGIIYFLWEGIPRKRKSLNYLETSLAWRRTPG